MYRSWQKYFERQLVLKSLIRIETGDKNARNEGFILLLCSIINMSTNTNDFVNQMITENNDFCTSLAFL